MSPSAVRPIAVRGWRTSVKEAGNRSAVPSTEIEPFCTNMGPPPMAFSAWSQSKPVVLSEIVTDAPTVRVVKLLTSEPWATKTHRSEGITAGSWSRATDSTVAVTVVLGGRVRTSGLRTIVRFGVLADVIPAEPV